MLLDTSAWIELFIKSGQGAAVREVLKREECHTSIVSFAEIADWALRNDQDGKECIRLVRELSTVLDVSTDIAILAGELNRARKKVNRQWGMMDSFVLATAVVYSLNVLTKDSQFRDLPNVVML